jgi:hypothetical protein
MNVRKIVRDIQACMCPFHFFLYIRKFPPFSRGIPAVFTLSSLRPHAIGYLTPFSRRICPGIRVGVIIKEKYL